MPLPGRGIGSSPYETSPSSSWSRDEPINISQGGPIPRHLPPHVTLPSYAAVLPPIPTMASRTSPGPQSNMVNSSSLPRAHAHPQGPLSNVTITSSSMASNHNAVSIHPSLSPPRTCHSPPSAGLQGSRDCRIEGEHDPQTGQCVVRHSSSIAALRLKAKEHAVAMGMVRAYNMRADV